MRRGDESGTEDLALMNISQSMGNVLLNILFKCL